MRILGIETSCDETAAAVVEATKRLSDEAIKLKVLSNVVASQIRIHAKTGGVVPEVAARKHAEAVIPVVQKALARAGIEYNTFARTSKSVIHRAAQKVRGSKGIDVIAVTAGPGLVTSLLVGVEVARTLSWLWEKPLVAVNHLAGHVYANWLTDHVSRNTYHVTQKNPNAHEIQFPVLALIVSGGHTELVLMRRHLDFKVIGSTRDDAAGEAFDKVAKMLGLGYPGGPAISALAEKRYSGTQVLRYSGKKPNYLITQLPDYPTFPRPMIHQKGDFSAKGGPASGWDFSFSGLKTAVLYYVREYLQKNRSGKKLTIVSFLPQHVLERVCYEFQEAVVDVLVAKTVRAAKQYKVKTVLLGGGVAANARLRHELSVAIKHQLPTTSYVLPPLQYTTDNAAMIAAAGYFMARAKQYTPWEKLDVDPNWELGKKFKPIVR